MSNLVEKTSSVKTRALFSKDKKKRYLLEVSWDDKKPKVCVIMSYASFSDELVSDTTTQLVKNNCVEKGFGSVFIVNVFCGFDDNGNPITDKTNTSLIAETCEQSDLILVAYGRGTSHTEEKEKLYKQLAPYKSKLHTIIDSSGQPFSHPLSPRARHWNIEKL